MRTLFSILLSLAPMAPAHSEDRIPTVFLTHFYVTLDTASYAALCRSPDVAALSDVNESHVVAGNRSWSGFYMKGRQTYMEFFEESAGPGGKHLGDSGLGLTVEESGGVEAAAARWRTAFGKKVVTDAMPRTTPSGTFPWFTAVGVDSSPPGVLATWVMEIDPGYLAALHPGSRVEHPLSRQQYLAWDFLPDRPLDNVVGLTAALGPAETSELATELELLGWAVERGGKGFVAAGPEVKLTIVPSGARAGIQQAELRLRRPVPRQEIMLGRARLLLEGETGRFIFWGPD
jgi:hypothetical protein